MPAFIQRYPLAAALAALGLVLLVIFGFEVGWGTRLRPVLAPAAPGKVAAVDAKLLPPISDAGPEQAYPETGTRPLFTPTRRPAPAAEATGSMVKGQFVLQGVTIMGETRIAMLRDKAAGKIYRIEQGRDVNGITVAEIERDRVTLRQGGDSEVVALFVQKGAATLGAIPPAAISGPFGAPGTAAAAADRAAAASQAAGAGVPVMPAPGSVPGMRPPSGPGPGPVPIPAPGAAPQVPIPGTTSPGPAAGAPAPAASMTPEELLARRRARRAQQGQ
jgi:hypothetical protein